MRPVSKRIPEQAARKEGGAVGVRVLVEPEVRFKRDDGVSQLCGRLVVFGRYGQLQFLAETNQFVLASTGIGRSCWQFAAVLRLSVDVLQQWEQFVLEFRVVMGAPESSLAAKFPETDATVGAGGLVEFLESLIAAEFDGDFRRCRVGFRRVFGGFGEVEVFLVTGFAQVEIVNVTLAHLGDVQRGRFRTAATFLHSTVGQLI